MTDLEIDNFNCRYIMPAGEDRGASIKGKLDHVAEKLLGRSLERAASGLFFDDSALLFIKNLELDFYLDGGGMNGSAIADVWSRHIVSATKKVMASPGSENVVFFRDREDYVASYISNLLNGAGGGKWYYGEFDAITKLDTTEAVRKVLSENIDIAGRILLNLRGERLLFKVVELLDEAGAEAIFLQGFEQLDGAHATSFGELILILSGIIDRSLHEVERNNFLTFRNCLLIYLKAAVGNPELAGTAKLHHGVRLLLFFKEAYRRYASGNRNRDFQGGFHEFVRVKGESIMPGVSNLIDGAGKSEGKDIIDSLVQAVLKNEDESTQAVNTSWGGIFLLARLIMEKRLFLLLANSPYPDSTHLPKVKAFLYLLAGKIAGVDRPDGGLFLFAGIESAPSSQVIDDFISRITPEMNMKFLESLLKLFPDQKEAVEGLVPERGGEMDLDTVLELVKQLLLISFAGRLRRFEKSSPDFIVKNFIKRSALISQEEGCICVELSKMPMDVVLRMSGFVDHLSAVPWLDKRDMKFKLGN